jgi:hypothetical protein
MQDEEVKKPKEETVPPVEPDKTIPPPDDVPPVEDKKAGSPGWHKRVKDYYKDREFKSDDDLSSAAEEMIDELMDYRNKGQEANAKLIEVFDSEPAIADFIAEVMKGAPVEVALARNFDLESLKPMEGEPDYAVWEEAKNDRIKRLDDQRKFEQELTTNQVESSKAFKSFIEENGLSEEEADGLLDEIDNVLKDIYRGYVSKDFLSMMQKATGYDEKIAKAREEAKLKAKNDAVKLEKKKYEKRKGDGLPKVSSTGAPKDQPKPAKPAWLQRLDEMEKRQQQRI